MGRRATLFWESRAYKTEGETLESTRPAAQAEIYSETGADANSYSELDSDAENEEPEILAITPARALDKETSYQEACARIDRLEGPVAAEIARPGGLGLEESHLAVIAKMADTTTGPATASATTMDATSLAGAKKAKGDEGEEEEDAGRDDPFAAEFSSASKPSKPPNPTYRVANEQADHRRQPRHRPRFPDVERPDNY